MTKDKGFFTVGIGASAGGLEAIQHFFKHLTFGSRAAFVVVQHFSPNYKSLMNELLARRTNLLITKVEAPTKIEPGHIYLMTPERNVVVEGGLVKPVDHKKDSKINMPIDLFFHSLGKDQQQCAIGIVLSGTGTDGSRGIKTIREHGGLVMVQDPEEATFDGMPKAALLSGVADYTLPVDRIAAEINRIVDSNYNPLLLNQAEKLPLSNELNAKESARRELQDQLEIHNEELQASNEELLSANEELQSSNEELYMVNTELQEKVNELVTSSNDIDNLLKSTQIATLFLDENLRIRMFTPAISEIIHVTDQDIGRAISDFSVNLRNSTLLEDAHQVLKQGTSVEKEVSTQDKKRFLLRILPYRKSDETIHGLVVTLVDLTEIKKARQQVRETTERLDLVLQSSNIGIWEWDLTTDTVIANDHLRTIFDIADPGVFDVQKVMNRIHPDDRPGIEKALKQALDNDHLYNKDFRVIKKDGRVTYTNGQGSVIRDAQGKPIKMLGTNVDITEKKQNEAQLRLSEERLTMAMNSTSDGIYDYYDMETGESWWSPRVYELLGLKPGEIEATIATFGELVHPRDQHLSEKARQDYLEHGKPFDIEFRVRHKTLGYRWFRSRANLVFDIQGKLARMVGSFADIHQRKTGEIHLRETNRKLRVANEYLDNFVFMAAHDLRSPVANLKSLTELWRSGHPNKQLIIDKVERSVDRLDETLSGLIQILDIQQYDQQQVSELNFNRIYQKLLAEMEPEIQSASISIRADFAEPTIHYIEPFLESMLRNLLSNAIKYRASHRPAEISLSTYGNNEFVLLQIQDNGIGIDLKRGRDKLFKAFERLTQEGEGQGIGMHLVKNMVEKNEGFIEVESEIDQGTTFKVYLKPYEE